MPLDARVREELKHLDIGTLRSLWASRFGNDWVSEREFSVPIMDKDDNVPADPNTDFYRLVFWKLWRAQQIQTHSVWSPKHEGFINTYKLRNHADH